MLCSSLTVNLSNANACNSKQYLFMQKIIKTVKITNHNEEFQHFNFTSSSQSWNGRILIIVSAFFREQPFIVVSSSTVATLKNSRTWTVGDLALNQQTTRTRTTNDFPFLFNDLSSQGWTRSSKRELEQAQHSFCHPNPTNNVKTLKGTDWLIYIPLNTKQVISEMFSWLGMEKQNLTQQMHAFTNQKEYTTTQTKQKKN